MTKQRFAGFLEGRLRRIATALVIQVSGAALAFLFSIVLARSMGVAGVGLYFLAVTIVDIGATVSRVGLETAGMRFVSIAHSRGDRGTREALYRTCMGLVLAAGVVIAFLLWLILPHLSLGGERAPELRAELPILLCALAPMALLVIQTDFLKGIGATGAATFMQAVLPPLLLVAGSTALWFGGLSSLHTIALLYLSVILVALACAMTAWALYVPGSWREPGSFDVRRLLGTSVPLFLVTSLNLIMGWTDILVLGAWSDPDQVGIYGVALRVSALTTFVMYAVSIVVSPQFAALHAEGNLTALRKLAQQSTQWTIIAALPLIILLIAIPEFILQIFGIQFKDGAWPLRILALGQLINLSVGHIGPMLSMTGNEKTLRNCVAASAVLNLVANLVLTPRYGAVGAATATAASLAFMNLACWRMVRKKLGINTLGFSV
ncbi:oligosaccharide flippase family protein [Bradyrhizobium lablabi]|uniref:oligosaccharide flippase family protein n=1 Tax=Bradyrhizobium lablabi TaxID=722472 RepID=UPI001BADE472|nr:oligosaccharide flippase family protein [Bradyrhizobium lablabi]MBR1120185.1 oligosaccharide flippase family protein [Bradyrhizobium lablabi]